MSLARTRTPFLSAPLTAAATASSRYSALLEVAGVWNVGLDERRLEQTRIQIAHHLRSADRREVRGALVPPFRTERVPECEQHNRTGENRADNRRHHERRLAGLSAQVGGPPADRALAVAAGLAHAARPCSRACFASTRDCDNSAIYRGSADLDR